MRLRDFTRLAGVHDDVERHGAADAHVAEIICIVFSIWRWRLRGNPHRGDPGVPCWVVGHVEDGVED